MRAVIAIVLLLVPIAPQTADPYRDAITLGRSQDAQLLEAFARGYDLGAAPPVARADITTEFRRAAIIVHEHALQGEFTFAGPDLAAAMRPWKGLISIEVELMLNPMNNYANVPAYDLYVATGPATAPLAAKAMNREAIYPPGTLGGPGVPIAGVRLAGSFLREAIAAAANPTAVVTDDRANVVWQARLDLSRYR